MNIYITQSIFYIIENQFFQTLIHMLNSEIVTQLSDQTKFHKLLNQTYDAILKNLMMNQESLIKILFTIND